MARPRVTVVGSYPRTPREGEEFPLRRVLQALDRGEVGEAQVDAVRDRLVREVIQEQVDAGVDVVTDGQVRWDDPQTRLAEGIEGMSIGGLIRYFDTNTYFRQPAVKGPIARGRPILVDEIRFAVSVSPAPVKAVLPGPYTMAALCSDEHYGDSTALLRDLAQALNAEAVELAAAGAAVVAFDEPALAQGAGRPPGDLSLFASVAPALIRGIGAPTQIQTFFGGVAALGPAFFELPFQIFGLDLVAAPDDEELLGSFPPDRDFSAGIVDGRNTKLESLQGLSDKIRRLQAEIGDRLWVSPSCGLEFLPREAAQRKCARLAEAARMAEER